jgi:hypothetical protein
VQDRHLDANERAGGVDVRGPGGGKADNAKIVREGIGKRLR